MEWEFDTTEFKTWCRNNGAEIHEGENIGGQWEIACVTEGTPGENHLEEVTLVDGDGLLMRSGALTNKHFGLDKDDIRLDRDSLMLDDGDSRFIFDL